MDRLKALVAAMSRLKVLIPLIVVIVVVLGAFADVITISQFGRHLWEPSGSGSKDGHATVQLASSRPTATPTPDRYTFADTHSNTYRTSRQTVERGFIGQL